MNQMWIKIQSFLGIESTEEQVLTAKLHMAYGEIRKAEAKRPSLSRDFDLRLVNQLQSIPMEQKTNPVWQSRRLQYAMSFVLLFGMAFVLTQRNASHNSKTEESAGVVGNTRNFQDTNTSVDVSDSYRKRILLNELKSQSGSIPALQSMERYYRETGRLNAAEEMESLRISLK